MQVAQQRFNSAKPLKCNYASGGNNHAQILRVPQYSTCNVTGTVTPCTAGMAVQAEYWP